MKNSILIILLLLATEFSFSQTVWVAQSSGVTSNLNDIFFISQSTGWAVGENGTIIKTTNGGTAWLPQTVPTVLHLTRVHFINANTGWTAGGTGTPAPGCAYSGIVLKTTNGGQNWFVQNNFGSYLFSDLSILSLDTMYLSAAGKSGTNCTASGTSIYALESGSNWGHSTVSAGIGYSHKSVTFINNTTGYIAAVYENDSAVSARKLFKTTNFGVTWSLIKKDSSVGFQQGGSFIRFLDANTGYYVDKNFYKTTNGGTNWSKLDSVSVFGMSKFNFINVNTGYIVGQNKLSKTSTGGSGWIANSGILFTALNSVFAADTTHVWACGANGKIIFGGASVGVHQISNSIPDKFSLYQNYPNPFNPSTNIKFDIPKSSMVSLKIYDVLGKEAAVLLNEVKQAGSYLIDFDASALTSGIYFYSIETETFTETKRMMILK